jgi:plasmid stabilization system protein ParE
MPAAWARAAAVLSIAEQLHSVAFQRLRMAETPCLLAAQPRRCSQLRAAVRQLAAVAHWAAVVLQVAVDSERLVVAVRQVAADCLAAALQ